MDEIERPDGISRRRMLKRIGAGAAIAWSAPVLTSLRVPAFAQATSPACPTCGTGCQGQGPACGTSGPLDSCLCNAAVTGGDCFCYEAHFCGTLGDDACVTQADCDQPGWVCVVTCCGTVCRPPCGSNISTSAGTEGTDIG
jgi:hypothetical protein